MAVQTQIVERMNHMTLQSDDMGYPSNPFGTIIPCMSKLCDLSASLVRR
jgi:hypothetical protein